MTEKELSELIEEACGEHRRLDPERLPAAARIEVRR